MDAFWLKSGFAVTFNRVNGCNLSGAAATAVGTAAARYVPALCEGSASNGMSNGRLHLGGPAEHYTADPTDL